MEHIAAEGDAAVFRRMINAPDEQMMPHRLRPKLGFARRRFALEREAASGTNAEVVVEMRILRHKVTKFVGGHAVVLENVVDNVDAQARLFIFEALVRGAGIVDLIEIAVFDRHVLTVFPNLDTVSETDVLDPVPNAAADKAEIAVFDGNALDERLSVNMDAAVFTAHIVDVYISFTGN